MDEQLARVAELGPLLDLCRECRNRPGDVLDASFVQPKLDPFEARARFSLLSSVNEQTCHRRVDHAKHAAQVVPVKFVAQLLAQPLGSARGEGRVREDEPGVANDCPHPRLNVLARNGDIGRKEEQPGEKL